MMKMIKRLLNKLFGKNKEVKVEVPVVPTPGIVHVPEPVPVVADPSVPKKEPTFVEDFSSGKLDPAKWTVSTWTAPGGSATHKGTFLAKNVSIVDGILCLKLTQAAMSYGVSSKGGEIATVEKFHYGTFEWEVKASSNATTVAQVGTPVSGSITGCFIYLDGAKTEIDFEVEGGTRNRMTQLTSWVGESNPNEHTDVFPVTNGKLPHEDFFKYKFVWMPGKIEFYRDDILIGTHTKVVPTEPASVMINHWGTDNVDWGGKATVGVERTMWVKNFKYTPL